MCSGRKDMNEMQEKVRKFHDIMGLPYSDEPIELTEKQLNRRVRLIEEEFDEFIEAWEDDNYVGQIDAICDLLYVVFGTAVEMGVDIEPFFNEVHRANLTKVNGHRNDYGKWIKPDDYSPPDIVKIFVERYGKNVE